MPKRAASKSSDPGAPATPERTSPRRRNRNKPKTPGKKQKQDGRSGDARPEAEYEAFGGRAKAADGTWIAWELVRPVPLPGRPKAPLLVAVNGLSNDGFQWGGLSPTLRKDHAVLTWDYRGHGCSEDPRDVSAVSIASLADDMEAVMLDVNARSLAKTTHVTVVAYSMGCQVALEWCRTHAQFVDGLALVLGTPRRSMDSVLHHPRVADAAAALMDAFPATFASAWELIFAFSAATSRVGHFLARRLGILNVTWSQFAPFYRHMRRLHGGAYARMLVTGQRHSAMDVLELMNRREVPTLVVAGGKDVTVGRAAAAAMRKAAPRAHFVELPNACHAGMIGERDAIAAALETFFAAKDEAVEFHRARLRDVTGIESPPDSPTKPARGSPLFR
jgi:pimeloyl-ACP methyl ester carboxylesterase